MGTPCDVTPSFTINPGSSRSRQHPRYVWESVSDLERVWYPSSLHCDLTSTLQQWGVHFSASLSQHWAEESWRIFPESFRNTGEQGSSWIIKISATLNFYGYRLSFTVWCSGEKFKSTRPCLWEHLSAPALWRWKLRWAHCNHTLHIRKS